MTAYQVVDSSIFKVGEVDPQYGEIASSVTRLSVSLTMDASSEIQFDIIDENFNFANKNLFQLRRNVYYRDQIFEISRVDVSQDASSHPIFSIAARSKNIQLMKRDKDPEGYSGITATDFASTIAARYNMLFFGQSTSSAKNIVKGSSARVDESVWDVLQRLASDNQFTVFETGNTLFFTSQEYLLGKWGDPRFSYKDKIFIPVGWPNPPSDFPGAAFSYEIYEIPSIGKSDDDWTFAEGSLVMDRRNGVNLRPGMTLNLTGVPDFEGAYLITAVEFEEGVPDPVRITFRSPNDPEPPGPGGASNGGYSPTGRSGNTTLPANIETRITEYIQRYYNPGEVPIAGLTRAQFYSNQYREVTQEAIAQATDIYFNRSQSEQTIRNAIDALRSLETYRRRFGDANIIYRALLLNLSLFLDALSPVERELPAYPKNVIRSAVRDIFGDQFMSTTTVQNILKNIWTVGSAVYFLLSTSSKNIELERRKNTFDRSSAEYRVLSRQDVVDALIPRPISVFDYTLLVF